MLSNTQNHTVVAGDKVGSFPNPRRREVFPVVVVTIKERTSAIVRGLDLVVAHHGADTEVREALSKQLHSYLDACDSEEVWMKYCKYLLAYPIAKYLRNELPSAPTKAFVPSGALRAWMKARLNAFNRRNTHLWYSWLQAKRSALPVSEGIVEKTYQNHFETLSSPDDGDWDVINEIFADPSFVEVLESLRRSLRKAIKREDILAGRASKSACYTESRASGGQIAALRKLCGIGTLDLVQQFETMRWYAVVEGPRRWIRPNRKTGAPGYYTDSREFNVCLETRSWSGLDSWADLGVRALWLDTTQPLSCTIQAVLEPMKVRVISKGEALPYYLMRPIQHCLHSEMRQMAPFRLIGRPLCPTDLVDLKERAKADWEWFSIDYSAATDGLSYRYSGRILRYLTADLDDWDREVAERVLGFHRLHYPEGKQTVYRGDQSRGQLMGSILSFPILCLANLGVYLLTMRDYQYTWTTEEKLRHVLVNGDDMVYAAPLCLWERHVAHGKSVGLNMSVGKAYHHREYVNVNSTSLHYSLRDCQATPWQIDYLNSGLFYGQHKVLSKSEGVEKEVIWGDTAAHLGQDPLKGVVANLDVVIRGSLPGRQCNLLAEYLSAHRDDIRDDCRTEDGQSRNLFLPESSGGMGCFAPPGWRWSVTQRQRQHARHLRECSGGKMQLSAWPLRGVALEEHEALLSVPWVKPETTQRRGKAEVGDLFLGHGSAQRMHLAQTRVWVSVSRAG